MSPPEQATVVVQGHSFEPGDRIRITRRYQAWIDAMDMNDFGESSYIG